MKKRGQITVFLAIGVVLLLLVATLLFINSRVTKENLSTELQAPETLQLRPQLRLYVESCLRDVLEPGVYLLGIQGGVIYPDDPQTVLLPENAMINYVSLNGINQLSTVKMEQDLARFVEESIDYCVEDLSVFAQRGIKVEKKGTPQVDVTITQNNVEARLDYEFRAEDGDDSATIDSFSAEVPIQLGKVVKEVEEIVKNQKKDLNSVNLAKKTEDYNIALFPFDTSTFVYSISDKNSVIDDAPFTMMFALRDEKINSAPILDHIADVVVRQGLELNLQLTAHDTQGEILTFTSSNSQVPITQDGLITATFTQAQTITTTFTVQDEHGLEDTQEVRFIVE